MSEIERASAEVRRRLLRQDRETLRIVAAAHRQAIAAVRVELTAVTGKIMAAAPGDISPAWLYQQARYQQLLVQAEATYGQFARTAAQAITQAQYDVVVAAQTDAKKLINAAMGAAPPGVLSPVAVLPQGALLEMVASFQPNSPLVTLLAGYGERAAEAIETELLEGIATGRGPREVARRIVRQVGNKERARLLTLARTETLRAHREATRRNYQANKHIVKKWRWSAALGPRTCLACLAMHGRTFELDYPMPSHPACFPAGTFVAGPPVEGSTERWFDGDLLDIRFAGGKFLSVTANHPILTPEGWIAAGALHEGRHVVSSSDAERVASLVNPNGDYYPALIEDVSGSLGRTSPVTARRVPTAAEDFHGDGGGSEVSIVRTNSNLRDAFDAALLEPLAHEQFGGRDMRLSDLLGAGTLTHLLPREFTSTHSLMGGSSKPLPFNGVGLCHAHEHAFAASTRRNASRYQANANRAPVHTEGLSEALFRLPSMIAGDDFGVGQVGFGASSDASLLAADTIPFGPRAKQSATLEFIAQSLLAGVEGPGGIPSTLAGNIELDCILEVSVRRFQGHVYNLQTSAGWYIANGIIVHNCRCSLLPVTATWRELGYDVPEPPPLETGTEWFARQPSDVQRSMMPSLAVYQAYTDGDVNLQAFVGYRHSRQWGTSVQQRSGAAVLGGSERKAA